jgi:hypothetical protein
MNRRFGGRSPFSVLKSKPIKIPAEASNKQAFFKEITALAFIQLVKDF